MVKREGMMVGKRTKKSSRIKVSKISSYSDFTDALHSRTSSPLTINSSDLYLFNWLKMMMELVFFAIIGDYITTFFQKHELYGLSKWLGLSSDLSSCSRRTEQCMKKPSL